MQSRNTFSFICYSATLTSVAQSEDEEKVAADDDVMGESRRVGCRELVEFMLTHTPPLPPPQKHLNILKKKFFHSLNITLVVTYKV